MMIHGLKLPEEEMGQFCRNNHIQRLALFGSILTQRFRPESDVDVLVEFEKGKTPGFLRLASMQRKLAEFFGGHAVDLRTPQELSRYFRDEVKAGAQVIYEQK